MRSALTLLLALLCVALATCAVNTNGSYTQKPASNPEHYSNKTCYHTYRASIITERLTANDPLQLGNITFNSNITGLINQVCNQTINEAFAQELSSSGDADDYDYSFARLQPTEDELKSIRFWNKLIWGQSAATADEDAAAPQNTGVAEWLRQRRRTVLNNFVEMNNPPTNDIRCNYSCYVNDGALVADNTERLDSINNRTLNRYDIQSLVVHALIIIDLTNQRVCNGETSCISFKSNAIETCQKYIAPHWGNDTQYTKDINNQTIYWSGTSNASAPDNSNKRSQFIIKLNNLWLSAANLPNSSYCN